ncbi:putative transcriptional regulatory protein C8D2.12c [Ceratocystis lukuohia]|uniref:Transcriptional regulatory protein C8D2.12c n=2 Tax=Ceratocystis TaxID=5157 RepID=A0ABR4MDM1_9PEZI|nr:putative transcriptional regulatory protein C8D2.12c [Ceratocystis platani]
MSRALRQKLPHVQLLATSISTSRLFNTSAILGSGHNRWSKIRHEKGAADRKKQAERNVLAKSIAFLAKTYGPDPGMNKQLAALIQQAKKSGATKTFIENSISRGLGRSPDGAQLENVMIEGMTPGNVALVIEVETDSKGRSLQDLKHELKKFGGKDAGSTLFFFDQLGKLVFQRPPSASEDTLDEIINFAIGQDAVDVEIGPEVEPQPGISENAETPAAVVPVEAEDGPAPGEIIVWTSPATTMSIATAFSDNLGLKQISVGVIWKPKDDMRVTVEKPHIVREITDLLMALRDYPEVSSVYANGVPGDDIAEEDWARVEDLLDGK